MKQRTIRNTYAFSGKGLHTGTYSSIRICPAPEGSGIVFRRTDLGVEIPALAKYVSSTARSTTISIGDASVVTIEHLLSALTGLGIDNARIDIEGVEIPILDGSARPFVEAIARDGFVEQDAERVYVALDREVEIKYENTGSFVRITPAEKPSYDVKVDFGSRVLGVQTAHWDESVDYASQIGICRTFVFFHELELLLSQGLVKGGDAENAIVVVERPVTKEQVQKVAAAFNHPELDVLESGYLSNLVLNFENECGRHKLLDLIGDLRLCGGFLKAHINAYKPGHSINTNAAKAVLKTV